MNIIRLTVKIEIALLASLIVNVAMIFTIPPTTTLEIVIKDVLSLLIGGFILVRLLWPRVSRRKIDCKD